MTVFLTAVELTERFRAKSLSPLEVTDAHLERIGRLDPKLNSYITVTAERARAQARASDARYRAGKPISGLDGVPFAPKDIFATRGIATTHGSKLGKDHVPDETATAVDEAGGVGGRDAGEAEPARVRDGQRNRLRLWSRAESLEPRARSRRLLER